MNCILAAVDFSDVSLAVIEQAEALARALSCPVYLVHVEAPEPDFVGYEPGPQTVRDSVAHEIKDHRGQLHAWRDGLRERGLDAHALVIQGPTAAKILEEARRLEAGLIVAGSHGHGALVHLLVGSVSEGLLRHSPCPVLIVPAPHKG